MGLGRVPRRRAAAGADEEVKVRQESTRDDAISTAGPRVMARRGPFEGARRGATMPRVDERQRVQYSTVSALLLLYVVALGTAVVLQRSREHYGCRPKGSVWSSTLATLALDHQWLANPLPHERLEGGGV